MKINLKKTILCPSLMGFALSTAMLCFTMNTSAAPNGRSSDRRAAHAPESLTNQISQYIQVDDLHFGGLRKGIIVVSFQVGKNNELRQVVSHSQIPELDRYLKSSLEGKFIQVANDQIAPEQTQFVKLRISIEK